MKTADGFQQAYNAQAAVEIESRLIVSQAVSDAPNDKQQLVPTLQAVSPVLESVEAVLIDSGFYSEEAVAAAERRSEGASAPCIYAATGRQPHGRSVSALEERADPPAPGANASAKAIMVHRLATRTGRKLYAQRKQTIEPVFGIIKAALGFRRFSLRGLRKVRTAMDAGDAGLQPQAALPRGCGAGRSVRTSEGGTRPMKLDSHSQRLEIALRAFARRTAFCSFHSRPLHSARPSSSPTGC